MIVAEPQNTISDYLSLGYNNNMQKLPDELYDGADKNTGVVTALNADQQIQSLPVNKLTTNKFNQVMTIGKIVLDGKKGAIQVMDKNNRVVAVIGKF